MDVREMLQILKTVEINVKKAALRSRLLFRFN